MVARNRHILESHQHLNRLLKRKNKKLFQKLNSLGLLCFSCGLSLQVIPITEDKNAQCKVWYANTPRTFKKIQKNNRISFLKSQLDEDCLLILSSILRKCLITKLSSRFLLTLTSLLERAWGLVVINRAIFPRVSP